MAARRTHHILSVLVENKPGVLARVAGLFARRGFNIFSLAVAPTDDERFSRITIVVDVESTPLEQITKQLFKLDQRGQDHRARPARRRSSASCCWPPCAAGPSTRSQVIELVGIFEGKILAVGAGRSSPSRSTAHPDKLDDFEELLRPYGIVELQRTGRVALPKLDRQATRACAASRERQAETAWPTCTTRRTPTRRSSPAARWRSSATARRATPTPST